MHEPNLVPILLADDDPDDRLLAADALRESRLLNELHCVDDGEELLDFLYKRGKHANAPRPGLILLDLNMPRKDGREALREIKADPELSSIPVVVLTTSKAEEDILRTYDIGVSSFILKPVTFTALVEIMESIGEYWFQLVALPKPKDEA
ncbi:MAG: response regulator [Planctomycetota bacterium]